MSDKVVTLHLPDDNTQELPVLEGTMGADVIDIKSLPQSDVYTFDPGFASTAACESQITFVDGDKGMLLYRGYPIEVLAEQADYLEVCYLLLNGKLPNQSEFDDFSHTIKHHTMVHEQLSDLFAGFRRDAHPMAMMISAVGALSGFYYDKVNISDPAERLLAAYRLIAKVPTIVAMCYKYSIGQPFISPQNHMGYTENFLHMLFGTPCEETAPDPVLARALDRIFTLHADHEQNASTSVVRLAGSTGANPFACIAAGVVTLSGPSHGGASEAVPRMLEEIGDESRIDEYIKRAKDKDDPFRLMGFGHRVYKNYDPRAKLMRQTCHDVLERMGASDDPLFKMALKLEKIALEDSYFVERKLYPNVDFYSGITLRAIGIPHSMFTVIFALARTVGWMSHWHEMLSHDYRIGRPRQLYTGWTERAFVSIDQR